MSLEAECNDGMLGLLRADCTFLLQGESKRRRKKNGGLELSSLGKLKARVREWACDILIDSSNHVRLMLSKWRSGVERASCRSLMAEVLHAGNGKWLGQLLQSTPSIDKLLFITRIREAQD